MPTRQGQVPEMGRLEEAWGSIHVSGEELLYGVGEEVEPSWLGETRYPVGRTDVKLDGIWEGSTS